MLWVDEKTVVRILMWLLHGADDGFKLICLNHESKEGPNTQSISFTKATRDIYYFLRMEPLKLNSLI